MGGSREFEITIVSAEDLPDIRHLGHMKVYAEVSVDGCTRTTHVDWEGDTYPTWGTAFVFDINDWYLERGGLEVVVNLYCERTLGDKFIGQAKIPVKDLFKKRLGAHKSLSIPISGTPYGRLNIRYCFEEKFMYVFNTNVESTTIIQNQYYTYDDA